MQQLYKVIFLDIDGVLNDHTILDSGCCGIDREKASFLNYIIRKTGARLIITSAWRYMVLCDAMTAHGFSYLLRTHGIDATIDGFTTLDESICTREAQIKEYLRNAINIDKYVIIDDLNLDIDNFVKIDGNIGLTLNDVEKAISILN